MYKEIAVQNRVVEQRRTRLEQSRLKDSISKVRAKVDAGSTAAGAPLFRRMTHVKRDGMTAGQAKEVQKCNRILIEKISKIMTGKYNSSTKSEMNKFVGRVPRGDQVRLREFQRIELENRKLFCQLTNPQKSSQYSHSKLEAQFREKRKQVYSMGKYPYVLNQPPSSKFFTDERSDTRLNTSLT